MSINISGTLVIRDIDIASITYIDGELKEYKELADNRLLLPLSFRKSEVTAETVESFFRNRIPAKSQESFAKVCKNCGVDQDDDSAVLAMTHGRWSSDEYWVRFPGETLTWEDMNGRH